MLPPNSYLPAIPSGVQGLGRFGGCIAKCKPQKITGHGPPVGMAAIKTSDSLLPPYRASRVGVHAQVQWP